MKRSWGVRPDEELVLMDGRSIGVVSQEAQQLAVAEAQVIQSRLGGYVSTTPQRVATEVPGEMVTTFLVVTWQDHTTNPRETPEDPATVVGFERAVRDAERTVEEAGAKLAEIGAELAEREWREANEAVAAGAEIVVEGGSVVPAPPEGATEDNPDGFDYSQLAAEDIEDEPVGTR